MIKLTVSICFVLAVVGCSKQETAEEAQTTSTQSSEEIAAPSKTPEEVVKSFMFAMMTADQVGVENEILPHPNAKVLWSGSAPPKEILQQIKTQMDSLTLKEFKVGETVYLPGGRKLPVTAQMVGPGNKLVVVTMGGQPMPTPLPMKKVDGEWKIDATSFIKARLAAGARR